MSYRKIFVAFFLIAIGVLFRTILHIGPNVEFVTTAALLSARLLGFAFAITVPLTIMIISDTIIGTTNIFLFTWSGYVVIGVLGYWGLRNVNREKSIGRATILGITSSVWFYLWTNFGVWLLDSWGMYPKTLVGLFSSYIMGLPFLKYNLIGNLIFVPVTFFLANALGNVRKSTLPSVDQIRSFIHL